MKKFFIIFLVVSLALLSGLYFTVRVAFPPSKIKALVEEQGSNVIGRELKVGGAGLSLFPTIKVNLKGLQLANGAGFSQDPLFYLGEVSLKVDFMSLIKLKPSIEEIRLQDLDLLYEVNAQGVTNLDDLVKSDTTQKDTLKEIRIPASLQLKNFQIQNARIRYFDQKSNRYITLGNINQNASVLVDSDKQTISTSGKLVLAEISIDDKSAGIKKGKLNIWLEHNLAIDLIKEELSIQKVGIGLQDIAIEIQGKVNSFLKQPGLDLKFASNQIKLKSLLQEIPPSINPEIAKVTAAGDIEFSGRIAGILDSGATPDYGLNLEFKDISLSHSDLPGSITGLVGKLMVDPNHIYLKPFSLKTLENPISAEVSLSNWQKTPNLEKLWVEGSFDLGILWGMGKKLGVVPDSLSLDGNIHALIQASGLIDPQNPLALKANGVLDYKGVQIKAPQFPASVLLNGKSVVSNQQIQQDLKIKVADSDVQASLTLKDYLPLFLPKLAGSKITKINFRIASSLLNLDTLLPKTTQSNVDTTTSAPLKAYPVLPPIEVVGILQLSKTKLMGLELTQFVHNISVKQSIVQSKITGNLYTGSISKTLTADLKDSLNGKFQLGLALKNLEANDFIMAFNKRLPPSNGLMKSVRELGDVVYGKLNLNMNVTSHGLPQDLANNLTGPISISLEKGLLKNAGILQSLSNSLQKVSPSLAYKELGFEKLESNLEAQDGKLLVKNMTVSESPIGGIDAKGSVGFNTELDLLFENKLKPGISQKLNSGGDAAKGLLSKVVGAEALQGVSAFPTDAAGRVLLFYTVKGTLKDPKFGLDSKRMIGGAKEAVANALKNKLAEEQAKLKAKLAEEKQKALDYANQKKSEVEAKLAEEKAKLEAQAKELQEKAKAEAEKQKQDLMNKAKDEAKKKLKGLGL